MSLVSRQTFGVVLVAIVLITAGCAGSSPGEGTDDVTDTTTAGGEMTTVDGSATTSATQATTSAAAPGTTAAEASSTTAVTTAEPTTTTAATGDGGEPRFTEGEYYEFTLEFGSDTRNLTWETVDVSGEQVTAETTYEDIEGQVQEKTLTGTHSDITENLSYPLTAFDIMHGLRYPMAGRTLEEGATWSSEFDDGTTDFEVLGSDTVDGVSCTEVRGQDRGAQKYWELCTSEDHPFLLSAVQYDQDDAVVLRIDVTEHP